MGTLSLQREEIVTRLALSLSTELIIFGLDNGPCHVYNIPATFPGDIQCNIVVALLMLTIFAKLVRGDVRRETSAAYF